MWTFPSSCEGLPGQLHSHTWRGILIPFIYLFNFLSSKLEDLTSCLTATGGFHLNSLELICLIGISLANGQYMKQPVIWIFFWHWERLSEDSAESCLEIWQPQRGSLSQRATACFSAENVFLQLTLKVKVRVNLKQSVNRLENKISRKKSVSPFFSLRYFFSCHCLLSCHCNSSPSCSNRIFFFSF